MTATSFPSYCHPERGEGSAVALRTPKQASFPLADYALGTRWMVYFLAMINFEDTRWLNMTGGYRTPFDPRPLLKRLKTDSETTAVWHELWDGLHHQGDIGEASFASVPYLVSCCRERGVLDWNIYAMVAIIELARKEGTNPDVPRWIADDYFQAIRELAEIGVKEVLQSDNVDDIRAILSIVAIEKGLRIHGKFLVNYSEDEMIDIDSRA